jgi:hypothetical protein
MLKRERDLWLSKVYVGDLSKPCIPCSTFGISLSAAGSKEMAPTVFASYTIILQASDSLNVALEQAALTSLGSLSGMHICKLIPDLL